MSMHNTEIPSGWFIDIHIPSQLKVKRTPPVNKSVDTENKSVDTENKSVETIDGTVLVNNDVQMTKNVNNGVNTPVSGPGRKISISIKEKPPPMKEPTHRGITLSKETQLRGVSVNKSLGVQAPAVSRKRPSGVCVASSELNVKPTKRLNTTGSVSAPVAPKPVEVSLESLSSDQRRIYNKIVYEKKNIFFTGSAGTGKSILLKVIIRQLQTTIGNKLAVTASTGIAALNINGTTLHSFANIKLGEESVETYVGQILKNKRSYESWERTETLIIDEVSMIGGPLLDKIEKIARRVRNNPHPFGGIQVVLVGDFFQLPPVNTHSQVPFFAFEAECWNKIIDEVIILKNIYRQKDEKFVKILNELRVGIVSKEAVSTFLGLKRQPQVKIAIVPTELYPLRHQVDFANYSKLDSLEGEAYEYRGIDIGNEFLLEHCIAPKTVILKKNAQVMLLKNLTSHLVNGSIGIVVKFNNGDKRYPKIPVVRFSDGKDVEIYPQEWNFALQGQGKTSRTQIPLILAYAMSIHKSQGQTIEYVKINLDQTFAAGQAYVALSRATCLDKLQVLNFKPDLVKAHPKVTEFYRKLEQKQ